MKFHPNVFLLIVLGSSSTTAFQLNAGRSFGSTKTSKVVLKGYLDDLSKDLTAKAASEYDAATESLEATTLERSQVDRYGPSTLRDFKDFSDEFDGGDGQMGVAGDGQKGLEQIGSSPTLASSLGKSKMMSAKNAWGTSSGYADDLLKQNPAMDVARAQQLENWQNQREIYNKNQWVKQMEVADDTNQRNAEVDWRTLAKFGVERNQDFSLDEAFGAVAAGDKIEETVSMKSTIGRPAVHTINLKNEYMGFADFRAAFTSSSSVDFTVTPPEGSLSSKESTEFNIKYKPSSLGISEGFLVIETEDFKKTWKFIGSTG